MDISGKWTKAKSMLLENASFRQTVFKNTFWLTISNIGGRLIRAVLLIYVARVLGTEGYGVFSYAVGVAAFFSIFADIGVLGMLTREGSREPEKFPEYLGTAVVLKFFLLVLTNVIMFIGVPLVSSVPETIALLPLAAMLITSDALRDISFSVTRAREQMEKEAAINIFTNLAITAFGIALIFMRPTPGVLLAGYTAGSAVGTLFSFWLVRKELIAGLPKVKKALMIPILREGFPFALSGILGTLMLNMDMLMLGWLSTKEALGLYSAAQRPVQLLYMIPAIMATALFPSFSRFAIQEKERFRSLFERSVLMSLLAAIPIVVGGIILADQLIVLLFGADFYPATIAFQALLLTILMNFPGIFFSNAIFAHNAQKSLAWSLALGSIANLVFNYIFIPRWGILGCSLATIGALMLSNGFIWIKIRSLTNFRIGRGLLKMAFSAILMGVLTWSLKTLGLNVILNIGISGVVFFAMLFLLKEKLLIDALGPFYRAAKRL